MSIVSHNRGRFVKDAMTSSLVSVGEIPNVHGHITFLFFIQSNTCWYAFESSSQDLSVE